MFELDGKNYTLEQINAEAQAQGVDPDKFLEFLKTKGLVDKNNNEESEENLITGVVKAISSLRDPVQRQVAEYYMKNRIDNIPENLLSAFYSAKAGVADLVTRDLDGLGYNEKQQKVREETEEIMKSSYDKLDDLQLEMKDTGKGIVGGIRSGQGADLIAGVFGAGISMAETVIPAALTYGITLPIQVAGPMYTDYNKSKAKALYGDDPNAIDKLVDNEETEVTTPLALGALATGLEYIGFKGVTRYIANSGFKGKNMAKLLYTSSGEGFTEVGQLGTEVLNTSLAAGDTIEQASLKSLDTMFSDEGLEMWLNGFLGAGQMSVAGRALNRAIRNDRASVKELNNKINNLAKLNLDKNTTANKETKDLIDLEIKEAEQDLKKYITEKRKIKDILNEDQKNNLINLINEQDNLRNKAQKLKLENENGEINNRDFGYAIRSINNQNKNLIEQIELINETAKEQLLQTSLEATKEKTEKLGLNQIELSKEEFAKLFPDDADADGTIDGKNIYINRDVAREQGAIGVGSHELLHGIIGNSYEDLKTEDKISLNKEFLNLLGNKEKQAILNRLDISYGITGDKVFETEELFTVFSDEIVDGKLAFNEGVFGKIRNTVHKVLNKFGYRKEFKNARQTYNFLKDYSKNIKQGKLTERAKQLAEERVSSGKTVLKSMTAQQRTTAENEIKRLGREGLLGENFVEQAKEFGEGIGKQMFDAEFDDIYKRIQSEGFLDNLIAAKYKGSTVPRDFVDKVYSELTSHAKNFNPENKSADLFIWLNSQIKNKATQVYNREYKVDQTAAGRARDIGETTQEGEVKVQVAADTDSALKALETEDLTIVGQAKKKAEETRDKISKFRKQLGFETGGELYNRILQSAKQSLLIAYNKTKNIKDKSERALAIRELIRKEYFSDRKSGGSGITNNLFKSIKDFLGTKQYINNLVEYKEVFVNSVSTSDFVQIERKVPDHEKIFIVFDRKLTSKPDVMSAINKDLLPKDAENKIDKGQSVNLYKKRMPTDSEIAAFADQPAINPKTGKRSGLKGTRKDGISKAMANSLVFDAIMQVRQSAEVVEALQDDAVALGDEATLAATIGREVDVKFSKTAQEIVEDTKPLTKTMGANQIRKSNIALDEIIRTLEKDEVNSSVIDMFRDIKDQFNQENVLSIQEISSLIWKKHGHLFKDASTYGVEGSLLTGEFNEKHLTQILANAKAITEAQVKQIGFNEAIKDLQNLKSASAIINWLKTYSKSLRTAKVVYNGETITTNEQVYKLLIEPLGIEGFNFRTIDKGSKITYNNEDVNTYKKIIEIKQDAKGSYDTMVEEAKSAIKAVIDVVKSGKTNEVKKSIIKLMGVDQVGTLRKMAQPGIMFYDFVGKTILDHRPTINDVTRKIYETIDNPTSKNIQELENYLNNTKVNLIPESIDNQLSTKNKSTGGMEVMSTLVVKNMLADQIFDNLTDTDVSFNKETNQLQNAFSFSRSTKNPTRGISILDFDDTLATSKSLVKFTRPDGTEGTLTPEQYAATYEDLSDLGYKFDFSEFSKVVDGKPAPLLNKAKKLASKFGTKDMFVLTARPADSAPAIKEFLKQNGLDIPLENITGLGNSTAEAKALWVADKVANGYNDFYFADDALKNVQAVQNMLDQFDVKSKVQQARVKFSRSMNDEFNKMLERTKGVPFDETFSRARALKLGKNKGKFQIFVPPSADDFEGLLYYFVGKGEQGNKDLEFFKQAVIDPFSRAYTELDQSRQTIINDWNNLRKRHSEVANKLGDLMPASEFTFDNAIRVYLYNKAGHDIPGLSEQEVNNMVERVKTDKALLAFAENLQVILKLDDVYVKPNEYWTGGSTAADVQEVSERIRRAEFLGEWIENKNEIFNEANLNKIEATYGSRFRSALEDVLYRMETGRTRSQGSQDAIANKWMRWLNNSVGAIMFINTKSALLQTISMINYVNYVDNNPLQAAKAFANQKQYWADFTMIFNSDFLKQRRKGLKTDVQTAEIASAVANATNKAQAAVAYLLKKGFLPTQMADSFAIAAGGATFYRNRVKTYLNDGLSQKEAEEKAFNDFRNTSEESQQSARPDRLSQQQVSNAGRLLLNFQNYPMQQARLFKKALLGLARGTGDKKQHLSRIVFYGFAQNMIFLGLQNALFAMLFDHEDEEEKQELFDTKMERILNGMVDTMLRGSGIAGGVIATGKNTILKAIQELEKGGRANEANIILEALNLSPAVGSKLRKINKGFRTYKYNKDAVSEMSKLNINNPIYTTAAPIIEGVTNVPTDRSIRLINQVREGFNTDNTVAQRISMLLGFSPYEIGVDPNKEVKEARKKGKEKGKAKKKQCRAYTSSGKACKNMTTNESGLCYAHD